MLVESDAAPLALPDPAPTEADRAIAEHAARFIPDGATLQTGIGSIPSTLVQMLAEGDGSRYGVHSEMFTTGPHAPPRGRQGRQREGPVRRRVGDDVRVRHRGALRVARRQPGRGVPARRRREQPRRDRAQPRDRDDQRRARHRYPRPGRCRHAERPPVLRDRRPRGLRGRPRAVAGRPLAALPAVHRDAGRRGAQPGRAVVRRGSGDHHAPASDRRRRDRVRHRRAPGEDGPPARRGARRDRPPRLPRRAAGGGGARIAGRIAASLRRLPRPWRTSKGRLAPTRPVPARWGAFCCSTAAGWTRA